MKFVIIFLDFGFNIYPYKSDLEIERFDEVLRKLKENFKILEAMTYEKVSCEILWRLRDEIFPFERIGKWWEKEKEIDIVGFNQKTKEIIFGEVKWSDKPVDVDVCKKLRKKSEFVDWMRKNRKEYYILFSKSGFTKSMMRLAKEDGVFLVYKDKLLYNPIR